MRTVAFCEIEPYPRAVLAKHWPGVPIFKDVRKLAAADVHGVDVICGGFPCQDISVAGRGAGIDGERSGLWAEYARLIGEIRPRYVIVENVAALLGRGLGRVLGDLAALGFDAQWHCIPASAVGSPQGRDRLWIVAYPGHAGLRERGKRGDAGKEMQNLAGILSNGLQMCRREKEEVLERGNNGLSDHWAAEPSLGRVVDGIPRRSFRLHGLGNAVVPQIPELIGRAIIEYEGILMAAIAKESAA